MLSMIQNKMLQKIVKKIIKELNQVDYFTLKHELMKMKWEALRANDDNTYNIITEYEELVTVLEKMFKTEEV